MRAAFDHGQVRADTKYPALQGLERAMLVVEKLADQPMRAKDLADSLGLKWTTAHRTLTYLRRNGYLIRDEPTGVYYVGPRLYYVGSSYLASLPVVNASRGYLQLAAQETSATVQLVQRYGRRSMNLLVVESQGQVVANTTIGFHFPLHCGSKGQVLLAFESPEFRDDYLKGPFERLTSHTVTDSTQLRRRLEQIREQGYAATKGDVQLSTGSVAAPVYDAAGSVIASVTLIVSYNAFDELKQGLVDVALRTSQAISLLMGWRPLVEVGTAKSG